MANLFQVLDGICASDFADETLASTDEVIDYAEAMSVQLSRSDARRIQAVGQDWRANQVHGNGEWSRMRHDAMAALEVSDP